jgi:hypothetical protein
MENSGVSKFLAIINLIKLGGLIILFGFFIYIVIEIMMPGEPYKEYESCGTDREKWEICVNSLVDSAVEDIKDGVWDDGNIITWKDRREKITNYVNDKIVDEDLRNEIWGMLKIRLIELDKKYPNIKNATYNVTEKLGMVNY